MLDFSVILYLDPIKLDFIVYVFASIIPAVHAHYG